MCLSLSGRVESINGDIAVVDYGGICKQIKIAFIKPKVGDVVLVHAGFAIKILEGPDETAL